MFDMSWGEVMLIGGVALVVIGPKDLPKALRTVGQLTARLKRMAGEFQSQFSEAMREAELDEVRREVEGINRSVSSATTTGFNPVQTIRNEIKGAVDGVPKPATQAMPGQEIPGQEIPGQAMPGTDPFVSSAEQPAAVLPEPAPIDPAAPPAYYAPEPAAEKPSHEALAAATAQLKADASRAAPDAVPQDTAPQDTAPQHTASTGRTS